MEHKMPARRGHGQCAAMEALTNVGESSKPSAAQNLCCRRQFLQDFSGGAGAALWFQHALRGRRKLREFLSRTPWPRDELAAAVRTLALQYSCHTRNAERALERADARLGRLRRQICVAPFAIRACVRHFVLQLTQHRGATRETFRGPHILTAVILRYGARAGR